MKKRWEAKAANDQLAPGSTIYNTIPKGTPVSVYNTCVGNQWGTWCGHVLSFVKQSGQYKVQIGYGSVNVDVSNVLQRVTVFARYNTNAWAGLQNFQVQSYHEESAAFDVTFTRANGEIGSWTQMSCRHFIIPNGTIVRLRGLNGDCAKYNGKYGQIVQWTRGDIMYKPFIDQYLVRLTPAVQLFVSMESAGL